MSALGHLQDVSRADFLTSVGLYLLSDRVVMVRLRKSFLKVSVLEQEERELPEADNRQAISELTGWVAEDVREIVLKAENDSRERALRQAIISLLPHFNAARDAVYLCVPQEQAIVHQVFLPLAAQDNLQQVLEYEIERQLPFKREDIYYDYLPAGKRGEKFGLYVFAIPKKPLDGLLSLLESFGIKPRGVETTVTALANYLLFSEGARAGSAAVVAGHGRTWEMIGVQANANSWKPTSKLLFSHQFPASEWAQGSGNELLQECLSQVPKFYRCGDLDVLNGLAAGKVAEAEDIAALGNPRLKGSQQNAGAETLPAIGAALRGVRDASLAVNFLRHEGTDREGKTLSLLHTVLMGLLLIALIAWGVSFPVKDELRLRQLQKENQKIEPSIQALRREDSQLQLLRKETSYLTDLDQRRGEVLRVLDELSKVVPNNVYLSNLRYRAGVLEVQGNAENASALIPLLERSALFENVGFNAPSNRGRDNRETFSLKADVEKPKVNAKETTKVTPTQPTKDKAKP
ncbi:MAG TPA: PilN domain-containing protein [Candidatus Binatia bacterium]|jgi:Tfp pilus assembly protein PilN